jgi:DNA-binding transcriptional LysR family regulator
MIENTRDLRAFMVLAEERHFGRASARLGMAQPNLSAVIRRLEENLAVRLFRRKPRVEPTEAGLVLLTGARAIFDQMDAIVERVKLAGDGRIGVVRAGFASTAMLTSLPDHLRAFRRDFPDIALQLREMHSAAQWDALKAGAIDAAITREVQSDAAISRKIVVLEKFVAIVPKQHPLAGRSIVRVRDLAAEPFVLCRRAAAPALYDQTIEMCAHAGFAPRIEQEVDEWHTVFAFVRGGFGVALAPEGISHLGWRGAEFRRIDMSSPQARLYLCWSADRASPALLRFVNAMKPVSKV